MQNADLHEYDPAHMHKVKITSGGQISIPASIRRRWGTEWLGLVDRGEHVELRPIDGDVVTMLRGTLKLADDRTSDEIRLLGREEDDRADGAG